MDKNDKAPAAAEDAEATEATEATATEAVADDNASEIDQNPPVIVKRKELIQRVATRAGMRPNQVRLIVEATLNEIGEAMVAGESINAPAIGRLGVKRHKETDNADVMMLRLKRKKPAETEPEALAEPAE